MAYDNDLKVEYDTYEEMVVKENDKSKIVERYYYKRDAKGGKILVHTYNYNVLKDKKEEYSRLKTDAERVSFLAKKIGLL